MQEKIAIRTVQNESEVELILSWAEAEKWNPGKYDYKPYFEMDKKGYLLLLVDEKPVGSISLVKYSNEFSFIGLFIVLPEYRSRGLGKVLWEAAMLNLEKFPTIGLYSVPQQVSRYSTSGFVEAYKNKRRSAQAPEKPEEISYLMDAKKNPNRMFSALCRYDKEVFTHNREKLLNSMLKMPQTFAFVSFNKNDRVNGYGIVRPCMEGFRIGPLYADDCESAKTLFRILLSRIPGKSFILDMPENNTFSDLFAEYFKLQHVSQADTVAMIKGEEPKEIKKEQ